MRVPVQVSVRARVRAQVLVRALVSVLAQVLGPGQVLVLGQVGWALGPGWTSPDRCSAVAP